MVRPWAIGPGRRRRGAGGGAEAVKRVSGLLDDFVGGDLRGEWHGEAERSSRAFTRREPRTTSVRLEVGFCFKT